MFRQVVAVPIKFLGTSGCGGSAARPAGTRPRAPRGRPTSTSQHYESSRRRGGGGAGSRNPRRAACSGAGVFSLVSLTVKPGPWCASGVGWRRSSWRPWGGTCVLIPVLRGGRADAGARREEAAARRARLGEARRPRMPAEPRRPAALPSEPAREARRRRPHSLDAGLVPDRGRDEAQRGEPRGGEGRGAHRDLGRAAGAAVRHGRARRRRWRQCSRCARRLVRVAPRAVEAGGEQDDA